MQSVEAPRRRKIETENVLGFNIERKRGREGERERERALESSTPA